MNKTLRLVLLSFAGGFNGAVAGILLGALSARVFFKPDAVPLAVFAFGTLNSSALLALTGPTGGVFGWGG
jgi:hypothetical protein